MEEINVMCILALSMATTAFFFTSACAGDGSMPSADACQCVCTDDHTFNLCIKTLHAAPPGSELAVYALEAERAAQGSYKATKLAAGELLKNASLPDAQRAAYSLCLTEYAGLAEPKMAQAAATLRWCLLGDYKEKDYVDAAIAIDDCAKKVSRLVDAAAAPLLAMAIGDSGRTMLASKLGSLAM